MLAECERLAVAGHGDDRITAGVERLDEKARNLARNSAAANVLLRSMSVIAHS